MRITTDYVVVFIDKFYVNKLIGWSRHTPAAMARLGLSLQIHTDKGVFHGSYLLREQHLENRQRMGRYGGK